MAKKYFDSVQETYLKSKKLMEAQEHEKKAEQEAEKRKLSDDDTQAKEAFTKATDSKSTDNAGRADKRVMNGKDWKSYADEVTRKISGLSEAEGTPVTDQIESELGSSASASTASLDAPLSAGDTKVSVSSVPDVPVIEDEIKGMSLGQILAKLRHTAEVIESAIKDPANLDNRAISKEIDNTIKILKRY